MDNPQYDPATPPTRPPAPVRGDRVEKWIRGVVLFVIAVVPLLAFGFSFGNVGLLGVSLGIDPRIAFLTGPIVDLSVTGLIVAASYLSYVGHDERDLWPVHLMSGLCGAVMIALNCGQALRAHQWQRAGFDAVAPALLIGWGFLGPWLLRKLADARATVTPVAAPAAGTVSGVPVPVADAAATGVPAPSARPRSTAPAATGPATAPPTTTRRTATASRARRASARTDAESPAPSNLAERAQQKEERLKIVRGLVATHGPDVYLSTIMARTGATKTTASRDRAEVVAEQAAKPATEPADTELEPEREMESVS